MRFAAKWKTRLDTSKVWVDRAFVLLLIVAGFQLATTRDTEYRTGLSIVRDSLMRSHDALGQARDSLERLQVGSGQHSEQAALRARQLGQLATFIHECDSLLAADRGPSASRGITPQEWRARVRRFLLTGGLSPVYEAEFAGSMVHSEQEEQQIAGWASDNLRAQRKVLLKFVDRLVGTNELTPLRE